MTKRERYSYILSYFREQMPVVTTELEFGNAFQLLCATLLSAQCTDKRINQVTPALFARYPSPAEMAKAEEEDVLEYIKSVSYPNSKAKHLVAMARMIVSDFGGEVPSDMDDLVKLPGVGRKTANVMQAVWFGRAAKANTPLKVEQELMKNIPADDVPDAHHWLLLHGRYVCTSRKPHCEKCPFERFCPKNF